MQRLLLASGLSSVASLAPGVLREDLAGKRVAVVPTASVVERAAWYVGADCRALRRLGCVLDPVELSVTPRREVRDRLRRADILFVTGGNTFFLLQEIRRTGAAPLIAEHVAAGKPYLGASAGSMVLAPDIAYVQLMDDARVAPGLAGDFTALGIVPFSVVPHHASFPFRRATRRILATYSSALDLRPISNWQVVAVTGGRVEVLTASAGGRAA